MSMQEIQAKPQMTNKTYNKMTMDEKVDKLYLTITGDEDMGIMGFSDRLLKVENFMENLRWLIWMGGLVPKTLLFILLVFNVILAIKNIF